MRCLGHAHHGCVCYWPSKILYTHVPDAQLLAMKGLLQSLVKQVIVKLSIVAVMHDVHAMYITQLVSASCQQQVRVSKAPHMCVIIFCVLEPYSR